MSGRNYDPAVAESLAARAVQGMIVERSMVITFDVQIDEDVMSVLCLHPEYRVDQADDGQPKRLFTQKAVQEMWDTQERAAVKLAEERQSGFLWSQIRNLQAAVDHKRGVKNSFLWGFQPPEDEKEDVWVTALTTYREPSDRIVGAEAATLRPDQFRSAFAQRGGHITTVEVPAPHDERLSLALSITNHLF
jgi:hypothetical protein